MTESTLHLNQAGRFPVITVDGTFDGRTVTLLCSELRKAVSHSRRVVVDATRSHYLSRPALAAFLSFVATTRDSGTEVRLAVQDRVYRAFDTLGFPSLFRLHRSVEEAIDSLGSESDGPFC